MRRIEPWRRPPEPRRERRGAGLTGDRSLARTAPRLKLPDVFGGVELGVAVGGAVLRQELRLVRRRALLRAVVCAALLLRVCGRRTRELLHSPQFAKRVPFPSQARHPGEQPCENQKTDWPIAQASVPFAQPTSSGSMTPVRGVFLPWDHRGSSVSIALRGAGETMAPWAAAVATPARTEAARRAAISSLSGFQLTRRLRAPAPDVTAY